MACWQERKESAESTVKRLTPRKYENSVSMNQEASKRPVIGLDEAGGTAADRMTAALLHGPPLGPGDAVDKGHHGCKMTAELQGHEGCSLSRGCRGARRGSHARPNASAMHL